MKKIVFCTITLQNTFNAIYDARQEDIYNNSSYTEKIYYPINAVLANTLTRDDDVTVVLIETVEESDPTYKDRYEKYKGFFIEELRKINAGIGAKINIDDPVIIRTEFKETSDVFRENFMDFFKNLEENVEIYADMTFGPRPISMIMMNVLQFAEKFFNCEVKAIYGKTLFVLNSEGKSVPSDNGTVYDISSLVFMGNLINILKAGSGKEAIEAFTAFLTE